MKQRGRHYICRVPKPTRRMRFLLTPLIVLLFASCVRGSTEPAERAQTAYFQQELDYTIEARLDDQRHELHARMRLTYRNNSPDTLRVIPFHVWPRAYSSDATAFARQQLRDGSTRFHFAPAEQRGTLDSLGYYVNGQPTGHTYSSAQPDVSILLLNQPLLPGETAVIETPFRVKIPASFSRLGHVGESYQLTQWFPKPAVYDRDGWHVMPYLDRGEFYSEFGNFTVRLTLPENYVVGATGVLQEAEERQWLLDKAATDRAELAGRTDLRTGYVAEAFPSSAATTKTITFRAEGVHDFAWFADKRFKVLHDTLQLGPAAGSGGGAGAGPKNGIEQPGTVDVWALFTETEAGYWKDATDYLKRSTRFYSDHVGRYPYPQVTGVQSALSAGGGMEYPMITVIARNGSAADLDEVLAHEVGHNWFYGILGSNERDHPWMDEGINSYYEQRYMREFYPERAAGIDFPLVGRVDYDRLGYRFLARQGRDQAPDTRSDSLSQLNYWVQAYSKPALAMHELAGYVGEDAVDRAIRAYYDRWKFRHPGPEDFFTVMNEATELNLDPWFPKAFITTATSDWRQGGAPAFAWSHRGDRQPPRPGPEPGTAQTLLDLYPRNDYLLNPKLKLQFGTAQEDPAYNHIFYAPLAGYNVNDGVQLGAAFHNRTLEPRKLEWMVAPMYGFGSGELTGFAGAQYRVARPFAGTQQLMVGLGTQRFSDFTLARTDEAYTYQRTALHAELTPGHPPITQRESRITVQAIDLRQQRPSFDGDTLPSGTATRGNLFLRLGYQRRLNREINPFGYALRLEFKDRDDSRGDAFEAPYLRLDAELSGANQYEPGRFLRYRLYGGVFLDNGLGKSAFNPPSALSLVDNAATDYAYDGVYLGRGASPGNWTEQQLERRQGGFRAPISGAFGFGRSNNYLLALNVDADLPLARLPLPLVAWFDAGYYGDRPTGSDPLTGELRWVAGLGLTLAEGRVGLYAPLFGDPDTRDLLEQRGSMLSRLSVRLNLAGWLPWRWVDEL